jgi:hypothetical protein
MKFSSKKGVDWGNELPILGSHRLQGKGLDIGPHYSRSPERDCMKRLPELRNRHF